MLTISTVAECWKIHQMLKASDDKTLSFGQEEYRGAWFKQVIRHGSNYKYNSPVPLTGRALHWSPQERLPAVLEAHKLINKVDFLKLRNVRHVAVVKRNKQETIGSGTR